MGRLLQLFLAVNLVPVGIKTIIVEKIDLSLWYYKGYHVKYGWEAQVVGAIFIIIAVICMIKYVSNFNVFAKIIKSNKVLLIILICFTIFLIFPFFNQYVFSTSREFKFVLLILINILIVLFYIIHKYIYTNYY